MIVLKFGGSSVSTPERILSIINILQTYHQKGLPFCVVFSAFGGVTDSLLEMSQKAASGDQSYLELLDAFKSRHLAAARALLDDALYSETSTQIDKNNEDLHDILHGVSLVRELTNRLSDYIVSFGERMSAYIISRALVQAGIPADYLDARKVIVTDEQFGSAKVNFALTNESIKKYFTENKNLQIITGFIGATTTGITTTLGRGGSDYTGAIFAAALKASCLEIWTDVDGVLTADPRKVKRAFTIPSMTYAEAMEMSHFGAKVIYPPTLQPVLAGNIPLYIKNTFNPDFPGTFISNNKNTKDRAVQGISSISHIALLTIQGSGMFGVPGIAARLFGALAQSRINVILITQGSSEQSITFAVEPGVAALSKTVVESAFEYEIRQGNIDPVKIEESLSIVAIIGENMRYQPGISGRMFGALGKNGINCVAIAQGSSELNVSVVIPRADEAKALNALHEAFFLSDTTEIHLFIIGVGLIGSTLLKQIQHQAPYLKEKRALEVIVTGLANSRKMIFNPDGVDLDSWEQQLQNAEAATDIPAFIQEMKSLNLSNTIFIDNTASNEVARFYEEILDASISISTPNKIATSSSYEQYARLKDLSARRGVYFEYETNVGAGLPVISTLNDLMNSGDQIIKIEAVLSGSLSYIFNHFKEGSRFSSIVKKAQELGYTEPDPRIDLNGIDVRRKLIILSREAGLHTEANDVEIVPLLPESCSSAPSVEAFFTMLEKEDDYFDALLATANASGKALRMVAQLDGNKASIGLQAVDQTHPFYLLSGSDNMIVFTTARYRERPLVIRGPGAGAEVTAAGVFAEVIKMI
jgi:aspartokinase/homoserine dehydrogenase 1